MRLVNLANTTYRTGISQGGLATKQSRDEVELRRMATAAAMAAEGKAITAGNDARWVRDMPTPIN